ncbi:MAG: OmpA family protein [Labilithrix sp.]
MTVKHRLSLSIALVLASAVVPRVAGAQEQRGYASNLSNPSERGSNWFMLDSLDLRGSGRLALGLVNDYSYRSLETYRADGSINGSIVRNQYVAHLGGAIVLADRVRIGLTVPLQVFGDGRSRTIGGVFHRGNDDTAVGDVRGSVDVRLLGRYGDAATVAAGAEVFLPSGSPASYNGDGKPRLLPRVLFAGEAGPVAYAARLGFMVRGRDEDFLDGRIGSQLVYGASVGTWLADHRILVGPELYGTTVVSDGRAFDKRTTPIEVLLGAHADVGSNLRVGAGAGTSIAPGYGSAVARALLSLEWVPGEAKPDPPPPPPPDRDGDGVPDADDACAWAPGPKSGDPALNGCPPPAVPPPCPPPPPAVECPACADQDRDKDGITNEADACPDQAGAADPDAKKNGCPKAFLDQGVIKIREQVRFRTGSAEIEAGKDSQEVLEAVLAVLKAHPEIAHLKIEGHTDDRGDATKNKALSKARAAAVVAWLVGKGIEASKLSSEGVGADRPLEPNTTDAGRAANRRVELHVEQGSTR